MPKRNWAAIAHLKDQRTRIAISLATDPEILACYAKGFPHLFMEGGDEGPLHVPLSALVDAAEKYSLRQEYNEWMYDRLFILVWAANEAPHLNIPIAYELDGSAVPDFLVEQLVGQTVAAGLVVEIEGKKYVVMDIAFQEEYPEIGSTFTKPPSVYHLQLADADFIALDK